MLKKLKFKILIPFMIILVTFLTYQYFHIQNSLADESRFHIEKSLKNLVNTLSAIVEGAQDQNDLQRMLTTITSSSIADKIYVINSTTKQIIASNKFKYIDTSLDTNPDLMPIKEFLNLSDTKTLTKTIEHELILFQTIRINSPVDHIKSSNVKIVVISSLNKNTNEISDDFRTFVTGNLIAVLLILVLCYIIINKLVLKPTKSLLEVMQKRSSGNKEARWIHSSNDEIGKLGQTMNQMLDTLDKQELILKKSIEEAEAANQIKSAFLANMSHEFRTPLNGISGFTEILEDTVEEPEQLEMLKNIRICSENLLNLVNDILDISKIEAKQIRLEYLEVDINQSIAETFTLAQNKIIGKDISLKFKSNIPDNLYYTDELRLKQVFTNILSNSSKFTEAGEIAISITLEKSEPDYDFISFKVSDTGIGMNPNQQKQVFTPFKQADESTTRKYGGTGLGMSICKNIVELMGGNIDLESQPGKGTTFFFTLPVKKGKKIHKKQLPSLNLYTLENDDKLQLVISDALKAYATKIKMIAAPLLKTLTPHDCIFVSIVNLMAYINSNPNNSRIIKERIFNLAITVPYLSSDNFKQIKELGIKNILVEPVWHNSILDTMERFHQVEQNNSNCDEDVNINPDLQILIAEDNLMNQKLIKKLLESYNIIPEIAENGQKALNLALQKDYDIIFMDMQMPIMGGVQATTEIRKSKVATPIIAMTANSTIEDQQTCFNAGMNDFINKPLIKTELEAILKKYNKDKTKKKNYKILIVEDQIAILTIMKKQISAKIPMAEIEIAENGMAACIKLGTFKPDIILTDLNMPDMDGEKLIEHIKNNPTFNEIKIYVHTGMTENHPMVERVRRNACEIFFKPTPASIIAESIAASLK